MLTPSVAWAYWMRGSIAGILYASGLSLSRCIGHQQAVAAVAAIVRQGRAAVNGEDKGVYYPLDKAEDWPLQFAMRLGVKAKTLPRLIVFAGVRRR